MKIDAAFRRRGAVPRKLLLRIQEVDSASGAGARQTTLDILAGPENA
jgi:hypothetical protein